MRIASIPVSLLFMLSGSLPGQEKPSLHREGWPKPEVMVAPAYPILALGRGIQQTIIVNVGVDRYGNVTLAQVVDGPCPRSLAPSACDLPHEAEIHKALAEKRRGESLDKDLSQAEREAKYKEFNTELWLSAQFEMYASAEQAARKWIFQSVRPAAPPGLHWIDLTFRFCRGDSASIQVIDPWTISVTGALYPGIDD
ncbi:MAG: hypothetical protein ACLQGV_02205 [Bryobacteraceae bacterium]